MTNDYPANYGYGGGNFSTTTYGAQGDAGGGGFMGGSQLGSQNSSGSGKENPTLRPLTIKQIIDAQEIPATNSRGEFKVDGVEVTQITIIGQVQSVSTLATFHSIKVDDGTGIIEIKKWIEADVNPETCPPLPKENDYIVIWGRPKTFNNRRQVVAHMIRPVTDFNMISHHFLEATYAHLYFTRGPPPSADAMKHEGGTGMFVESIGRGGGAPSGKKLAVNLSFTAKKIHSLLATEAQNNEGMHVSLIANRLGMQTDDVFTAGDELLGTGVIYTTADDETWALLEY